MGPITVAFFLFYFIQCYIFLKWWGWYIFVSSSRNEIGLNDSCTILLHSFGSNVPPNLPPQSPTD